MIVTGKPRVPFSWLLLSILPWGAVLLKQEVMGQAFTFSLMKFIENPAGLTFVLSLPTVSSVIVAPLANFMADRVWTRFGRRKPFIVTAWAGVIVALTALPFMPSFWAMLACYLVYSFFNDLGGPNEQLKLEVVPPPQRGVSTTLKSWLHNIVHLLWAYVAIGRFDDRQFMAGVPISGEASFYLLVAVSLFSMLLLITLGIKETNPHSQLRGQRLTIRTFLGGILSSHLWPVYLLVFAYAIYGAGLGVLSTLLMIEQWGYTIQDQGTNIAVGSTLNIFLIMGMLAIADRIDRIRWFPRLMLAAIVVNIGYYLYIETVLYDGIPSLVEIICFGEVLSIIGILIGLIYTPLVYDFVSRNEMGTYMAGQALVSRLTGVITLNGIGLFAWAYAAWFMPPGGEMVRVVLAEETTEAALAGVLAQGTWTDPETGRPRPAGDVTATAWYATNAQLDHGRGFEIRLRDDASVADRSRRDALAADRTLIEADIANANALGDTAGVPALRERMKPLSEEIAAIDARLARRAERFRDQVTAHLGGRMVAEGAGILSAAAVPVALYEIPLTTACGGGTAEQVLDDLRRILPEVIDVQPRHEAGGYRLAISCRAEGPTVAQAIQDVLQARLGPQALDGRALPPPRSLTGLRLTARIVEEPLDLHVSPINRAWAALTGSFLAPPRPDRRLIALGRALREPGLRDHVRVTPVPEDPTAIGITVLRLPEGPAAKPPQDGGNPRLATLLAGTPDLLPQATALHQALLRVGSVQRITLARPVVTAEFAPLKYDYMAGYLWMLALKIIGLVIIAAFIRKVRDGRIRRRGIEEMEATP